MSTVIKEGAYHWTGKMFLSKLSAATQYRARVRALNDLGWSKPAHQWNFATMGAGRVMPLQQRTTLRFNRQTTKLRICGFQFPRPQVLPDRQESQPYPPPVPCYCFSYQLLYRSGTKQR